MEQPYDLLVVQGQAGMGYSFELARGWFLEPQLQLGILWMSRQFLGFTTKESLTAGTLAPAVQFQAAPSDAWRIGLRVEGTLFFAQLGGPQGLQAACRIGLLAGYTF